MNQPSRDAVCRGGTRGMNQPSRDAACRAAFADSSLAGKARLLGERASPCRLCPRRCEARRAEGGVGFCGIGAQAVVASASPHFGEERVLVGRGGSGTIFFSSCPMACVFCQNADISHSTRGQPVPTEELAVLMLRLQDAGCHNINLVTPTHVVHAIVAAVALAARRGLRVPLVYNCGGYESVETLRLLDGIVDIYMPDIKFASNEEARRCCGVEGYWDAVRAAVREMHRQVGDLAVDGRGVATRGLLVRHLVMPGGIAGTRDVVEFLSREISRDTWLNVMAQYRPCGQADRVPGLERPITRAEYRDAVTEAQRAGLVRGLS